MKKIIPVILFLICLSELVYPYGPYIGDNFGAFTATNMKDCTSYVLDMGILRMAEYRMLENDSGHQFLFRGKTVPEHIDSLFISMNDSNYLLITFPELSRFHAITPRCELDSNSLLRQVGLIGTRKYHKLVWDTTNITTTRTDVYTEFKYNSPPDYFLVFLIKGNEFNNMMKETIYLMDYMEPSQMEKELRKLTVRPRIYKDSTAYYRFILPVWTETFIDTDDLMPCIEDD